jgi:alginate O-acetyltransferase complex protein AlgJ
MTRPSAKALLLTQRTLYGGLALIAGACHPAGAKYPWRSEVGPGVAVHAEVRTLNPGYDRLRSHVLVREIDRPTRANLDYAAYHANFMIVEEPPESAERGESSTSAEGGESSTSSAGGEPSSHEPFAGLVDSATLTADVARTPLTEQERQQPLAFVPLLEFALARKVAGAETLEDLGSGVRSETWGLPARPGSATQTVSELFLHRLAAGAPELWLKIEFAPWFKALGQLPDQDHDGVPEVYARMRAGRISTQLAALIDAEYRGRLLDADMMKTWANQLASYWYPSFNTDLVAAAASWPDSETEPEIRAELNDKTFAAPSIIMRGKPQGRPTYEIFVVKAQAGAAAQSEPSATGVPLLQLPRTQPTPHPQLTAEGIRQELAPFGEAGWSAWNQQLVSFHAAVRKKLASQPRSVKALAGADGFLFYRTSLESLVGGAIEAQPVGKNPLPVIVEFKKELEAHGVDFLFVPVPSKVEVFPDELDPAFKSLSGHVVHPALRQFLLSLAEQGVEVVDLLTPLLAARAAGDAADQEPLYQRQDTHWTDRGLRLAADVLRARIQQYPWYAELARHAQHYSVRDSTFTRFGDLHARLPEALKKKYRPETLRAQQVLRADGSFYDDDPDSPITVLGDSFAGVYELTDAEHAGLSAHVARGISYPVDLVMSYGGGPNVRNKLLRRGTAALDQKKLVIWVMAARDLYNYWEDWQPLKNP